MCIVLKYFVVIAMILAINFKDPYLDAKNLHIINVICLNIDTYQIKIICSKPLILSGYLKRRAILLYWVSRMCTKQPKSKLHMYKSNM